jgi:hypothetical protein
MESKIFARLKFDPGILVILLLIAVIVLAVLLVLVLMRQTRMEANYRIFMGGKNAKSLEESFRKKMEEVNVVKEQTDVFHTRLTYLEKNLNRSYQKCGVVKYDAFKEMSGQLSFAYALLNDSNTGFVINSIHSREGSYNYIKDIVRGECTLPLSEEEELAVKQAMESRTPQPVTSVVEKRKIGKSIKKEKPQRPNIFKKKAGSGKEEKAEGTEKATVPEKTSHKEEEKPRNESKFSRNDDE